MTCPVGSHHTVAGHVPPDCTTNSTPMYVGGVHYVLDGHKPSGTHQISARWWVPLIVVQTAGHVSSTVVGVAVGPSKPGTLDPL